ncbi:MAG TPA: endolytic transglycosylase MltG [Flavipsychrobacter sp.]|nr:endolytic transglycosylase MltG [Flavipsychrobacter sp.]
MTRSAKRILLVAFIIFDIVLLFLAYRIWGSNTGDLHQGEYLYIKTGSSYEDVKKNLKTNGFIKDLWSFDILASKAGYPQKIKAGKYRITGGMSNYQIVRMLRSGRQTSVKMVIKKLRTKQDFIFFVSSKLEADSNRLRSLLGDTSFLSRYGLDSNNAMAMILPDTYEFWWNTSAQKTLEKLASYYQKYWNEERIEKAKAQGLTAPQAVTLASIIEEETNYTPEKDTVASVYLNRLHKGMKLQADPTARFAYGDFTIKRITSVQTNITSPYNTYYVTGLPPGPICTPSKKSIEAVLNAAPTAYLYFCAKEDFSGSHRFAKDYTTHQANARKFQEALNRRGIK